MRGSRKDHVEKWKKFVCWSAIESDSQMLVDTQKLVNPVEFCIFWPFSTNFQHEPGVNKLWAWCHIYNREYSSHRKAHFLLNLNQIRQEEPAFGCQPGFGSHSQSLTNTCFCCFLREPNVSLSWEWWKGIYWQFLSFFNCLWPCKHFPDAIFFCIQKP